MATSTTELRTLPARLETLLDMSRQLCRIQPLDALLGSMAEACGSLLDSDSVGIRVVDGDDLVLVAVWGDAQTAMPTLRIKIGQSLTGLVAATGKISLGAVDTYTGATIVNAGLLLGVSAEVNGAVPITRKVMSPTDQTATVVSGACRARVVVVSCAEQENPPRNRDAFQVMDSAIQVGKTRVGSKRYTWSDG